MDNKLILRVHTRCGSLVQRSDNNEYEYQCCNCSEDLYSFETAEKEITEDTELYVLQEYYKNKLDIDGNVMFFESYDQAESYILEANFEEDTFNIVRVR